MAARRRLDTELVRRGLLATIEQAQRSINESSVTVNGSIASKATHMVLGGDAVEVLGSPPRFVGRGGEKLDGALDAFGIDVAARHCVDVGSSTGGFTDCLLQRGAARVVAIDVGRAQLHERLGRDGRVEVHEQTDVRNVAPATIGAPFDLVVVDVSFIGLDRVLDAVASLAGELGQIVALVKPQFEAERVEAARGQGVIYDPEVWRRTLEEAAAAARRRGLVARGVDVSPIKGAAGNVEFFLWLGGPASGSDDVVDAETLNAAVDRACALP